MGMSRYRGIGLLGLALAFGLIACQKGEAPLGPRLLPQERQSDFLMPFHFGAQIEHERLAPGLTPSPKGQRGENSRYVLLAQDFLFYPKPWQTHLHGFLLTAPADPRLARDVELSLYAGPQALLPKPLVGTEAAPFGTPLAAPQGLRLLSKSPLRLPPSAEKPWPSLRFATPLDSVLKPEEALLLRVRYLDDPPKPGLGGFFAGEVALLVPNVTNGQSLAWPLATTVEPQESACDANPEGAMVCYYPLGYAEYFSPQNTESPAAYGRYLRQGTSLTLSLAGRDPQKAEILAPDRPYELGDLGKGFVRKVLAMNDERCRPYAPAWRALKTQGIGPADLLASFEAGFGLRGKEGLAIRTKNGRLFGLARSAETEPWQIRLDVAVGQNAKVSAVWSPPEGRAMLVVHETPADIYKVYSYESGLHYWLLALHREVPWRPWLPPESDIQRVLRPTEIPAGP